MNKSGIIFSSMLIILITSWIVVSNLTPYGSATSPDSLAYLDIANNIKNGKGFLATDFSLDNVETNAFKAERYWPPLYARLLSIFIGDASDVTTVSIVSRILLAVSIIFIFLITYEVIGSVAFIPSLLLCVTAPVITVYTYAWSETLFLPIFIIVIWASIKYLDIGGKPLINRVAMLLILLTMLIMLAYTRYIGIVFAILLPVVYFLGNRDTLDRLLLSAAAVIYTAVVGYLLYGNYTSTGYISGMARPPADKTVVENIIDVYYTILAVSPASAIPIISGLIVSVSVVLFIKKYYSRTINTANKASGHRLLILIIVTTVYLVAIVSLRSVKKFDMLDIRLLSPALVTIYILIAVLPSFFNVNNRTGTLIYIVSFFLIASYSINGYQRWLDTTANWKVLENPRLKLNSDLFYNNFTKSPATNNQNRKIFSTLTRDNGFIVVDKPLIYKFTTGAKCVQKPENIDPDNLSKINSLPAGSLLMLNKHELDQLMNKYAGNSGIYKYINFGSVAALQLPINTSGN